MTRGVTVFALLLLAMTLCLKPVAMSPAPETSQNAGKNVRFQEQSATASLKDLIDKGVTQILDYAEHKWNKIRPKIEDVNWNEET